MCINKKVLVIDAFDEKNAINSRVSKTNKNFVVEMQTIPSSSLLERVNIKHDDIKTLGLAKTRQSYRSYLCSRCNEIVVLCRIIKI